jgi:RimJ/RimL family protein N-acetyltransferase
MIIPARTPDERAFLISYIAAKNKVTPRDLVGDMPYTAMAAVKDGKVLGAVLYINYRGPTIEMACAGEPGWLTRENLRGFFAYPFEHLKVRRVTGIVHRKNKHARSINERLGFKLEGVCRHGFEDGDACVYGLIKQDCRWIRK